MKFTKESLLSNIISGDHRALARALTHVENDSPTGKFLVNELFSKMGRAHIIGITGAPGSGKSSLVDRLIGEYRSKDLSVAVLALDPSSPFSGGAILGDRIRMLQYTQDPEVFIRSMASRGKLGGLSIATFNSVLILDVAGFDRIIIETVGTGQSEVEIAKNCDTTLVVTVPGMGDDIQLIKAGIMEIADIFLVNKSDKSGADEFAAQMRHLIDSDDWTIPVCLTSATQNMGISDLIDRVDEHWQYLNSSNKLSEARKNRIRYELSQRITHSLTNQLKNIELEEIMDKLLSGAISIDNAVSTLIHELSNNHS